MNEATQFLLQHGYLVLFAWVLLDQVGVPVVVLPVLLAAGALAASGDFSWAALVGTAASASFLATQFWFELGRRRGFPILQSICRISQEPSVCVRQSQEAFARHGTLSLLAARFVPGLNAVAPPLAGISRMPRVTFLVVNAGGALLWAAFFITAGALLKGQLEEVLGWALRLGHGVLGAAATLLVAYVGYKYFHRQRVLRQLRIDRITPEELRDKLENHEDIAVLDVRHPLEVKIDPRSLPGAVHLTPRDLEEHPERVPPAGELAVYCNCPNEATSARTALLLKRRGVERVRPVAGGFGAWAHRNLPLVPVDRLPIAVDAGPAGCLEET